MASSEKCKAITGGIVDCSVVADVDVKFLTTNSMIRIAIMVHVVIHVIIAIQKILRASRRGRGIGSR